MRSGMSKRFPYVWVRSLEREWLLDLLARAKTSGALDEDSKQFVEEWYANIATDPEPIQFTDLQRILALEAQL